ncbi:MAG: hypothetical protein DRH30_00830 [Deltaproteobacteria bacterium]|nr:MAG: hypothetical protein DRH30_00830 [Deltaproteobacteria bacterium]
MEFVFQWSQSDSYHFEGSPYMAGVNIAGWVYADKGVKGYKIKTQLRWDVDGKWLNQDQWAEVKRGMSAVKA